MGTDPAFGAALRHLMDERGLSYRETGRRAHVSSGYISDLVKGRKPANSHMAKALDDALGGNGTLIALVDTNVTPAPASGTLDALDFLRRIESSDVSSATLGHLAAVADDLATSYATTPPEDLLPEVRQHLAYVGRLTDARMTLAQRKELAVIGGWLSLLAATLHIDLTQPRAASIRLAAARTLADHAGHAEIQAWCLETRAWEELTAGRYAAAADLSAQARAMAPRGGSALIQATAQAGRAHARMGNGAETRAALRDVEHLVAGMPRPDRPEHHYQYDPAKAESYTATTLSWIADPAAISVARDVVNALEREGARPRRAASARLDLSLALIAADQKDEAAATAVEAITSGRIVASNWWRATEIVGRIDPALPEAADLRDAYHAYAPTSLPDTP